MKFNCRDFIKLTAVTTGLILLNTPKQASARPGYTYFPHWMESAILVKLMADAFFIVWLAYKFLPIICHEKLTEVKV
jgi:Ni/Fe-hydrogenase subunit HybB-like protein